MLYLLSFFFFNVTAPTEIYTLSLHDALPIYKQEGISSDPRINFARALSATTFPEVPANLIRSSGFNRDRKSTRLNSSHSQISYAVFCLKKKKITANSI